MTPLAVLVCWNQHIELHALPLICACFCNANVYPSLQAIELLIERLAAQALQEQVEQDACSAVQVLQADQAQAALETSRIKIPAESPDYDGDAGELDSQGTLAVQHPRNSFRPYEPFVVSQSHDFMESVNSAVGGAVIGVQRNASLASASSEGRYDVVDDTYILDMVRGSSSRNKAQQGEDQCKQGSLLQQQPKVASKHEKKPARNRPCPCGSGRRYKECCGPVKAAQQRKQSDGMQASEPDEGHGLCMSALYV